MEIVRWAHEHGSCSTVPYKHVALGPHLAMLRWAREHGCPW